MKKNIILKGTEVYSQVQQVNAADYPMKDKKDRQYWLMSYTGIAFTMRQAEFEAWNNHEISELILTESSRKVQATDPNSGDPIEGEFIEIPAIQYTGRLNFDAAKTVLTQNAELIGIQHSILKKYNVSADEFEAALGKQEKVTETAAN